MTLPSILLLFLLIPFLRQNLILSKIILHLTLSIFFLIISISPLNHWVLHLIILLILVFILLLLVVSQILSPLLLLLFPIVTLFSGFNILSIGLLLFNKIPVSLGFVLSIILFVPLFPPNVMLIVLILISLLPLFLIMVLICLVFVLLNPNMILPISFISLKVFPLFFNYFLYFSHIIFYSLIFNFPSIITYYPIILFILSHNLSIF